MDKNWLIRTKSNHILGPVSKEKVLELYQNGSIRPDDEVCSGNGYWFFIREEDLVERFLVGNEVQSFNPISEAKDVLTHSASSVHAHPSTDDITIVEGLNLSMLQDGKTPSPETPPAQAQRQSLAESAVKVSPPEPKKKNNIENVSPIRSAEKSSSRPIKKQNWLQYVWILGFVLLFLMVYFRKTIIHHLFSGEVTLVSLISEVHAQENIPAKKKTPLENNIVLDKVTFKSQIGLDGFRVISSFDIQTLSCSDLNTDIYQLAVILHPPEFVNEKFLIKLRDCVLKLPEGHPLKKWMKWMGRSRPLTKKEQEERDFLSEILNSRFNLITDAQMKKRIANVLHHLPEKTLPELLLKSYLYLMMGNITRSDNLMKDFLTSPPRVNWERSGSNPSTYHKLAKEQFSQLMLKLSGHPADRKVLSLLVLYLENFYNEESLLTAVEDVDTNDIEAKINFKYIEYLAPSFVHYLRMKQLPDPVRMKALRDLHAYPLDEQAYWIWAFLDIDPLISDVMNTELVRLEKEDQLWFIYLMENEKLADIFSSKAGKSFLPGRRPYLKEGLNQDHDFMMSLYKLIELGDINDELIIKTVQHLVHE